MRKIYPKSDNRLCNITKNMQIALKKLYIHNTTLCIYTHVCNMLVILHTYYDNSTHFTKDKHAVLTAHI